MLPLILKNFILSACCRTLSQACLIMLVKDFIGCGLQHIFQIWLVKDSMIYLIELCSLKGSLAALTAKTFFILLKLELMEFDVEA